MNRVCLSELGVYVSYPCLSLFVSCKSKSSRVAKINKAFEKAVQELQTKCTPEQLAGVATELHVIHSLLDLEADCKSVAIFINKHIVRAYALPFEVPEAIVIDKMFDVNAVRKILNRIPRYWLLLIHNNTPYLFEGYENGLFEVVHRHNTWKGEDAFLAQDLAGKVCDMPEQDWGAQCRYGSAAEFMNKLDAYLKHFFEKDALPLVLVSKLDDQIQFKQLSFYASQLVGAIAIGSLKPLDALAAEAWPMVEKYYDQTERDDLKELKQAAKASMVVTKLSDVWNAAQEGRIRLLCVEEQLQASACEDQADAKIRIGKDCDPLRSIDAVDEIIELTRNRAIRVSMYKKGALAPYGGIAAILTD